jgi:hypothetical protein
VLQKAKRLGKEGIVEELLVEEGDRGILPGEA